MHEMTPEAIEALRVPCPCGRDLTIGTMSVCRQCYHELLDDFWATMGTTLEEVQKVPEQNLADWVTERMGSPK